MTEPLLEYYSKKGILESVKGETSKEILPQIVSTLTERFK
jgi:adenylate kinase family enzyme